MPWQRELQSLEAAIVRLNAEYDSFLYGSATKPPLETRRNVDQMIRRISAQELDSSVERYHFTTLQGRFNALCERWDRLMSEKELGKRPGVYGGFARESRRVAAAPQPADSAGAGSPPNAPAFSSVETERPATDPDADLFERYLAARKARGEDMHGYDLPHFKQSLEREREKLKERFGAVEIDFDVAEREGRVKLIARRRPSAPPGTSVKGSEGK